MAKFRLLSLPPELQAMIYELVFVANHPIWPSFPHALEFRRRGPPKSLLATCRSVRDIASAVYYGQNTFEFKGDENGLDFFLSDFAAKIGRHNLRLCSKIHLIGIMWSGQPPPYRCDSDSEAAVSIEVNVKAGEITWSLELPCCGLDQSQHYTHVVRHAEALVRQCYGK